MKTLSIRKKLIIYFVVIFLVFSSVSLLAVYRNYTVDRNLNLEIVDSINSIELNSKQSIIAQLVRYDDEVLTQSARNYAFTGDKIWKERYFEFVPKLDLRIKEAIQFGGEEDKNIFKEIESANNALIKMEEDAIAKTDDGYLTLAQNILASKEYSKQKSIYKEGIDKYIANHGIDIDSTDTAYLKILDKLKNSSLSIAKTGINLSIIFVFLFFGVVVFLFGVIFRTFFSPLTIFKETAKRIINGDLSARVKIERKDEIGVFADDFNTMVQRLSSSLNETEKRINEKTKEISEKVAELDDQKKAILNILEDVEKEKDKSEELAKRFDLATKSANIGVWEWNVVENKLIWDDQMYLLYGVDKNDFSGAYDAWRSGLHPDDRASGDEAIRKALKGEKDFTPIFRVVWPSGEIRYIQAYAIVERDSNQKPIKMIGVNFDITREKEIDKVKTEFVSLASHQLRTPLSAINWYTEMLLSGDAGKITKRQKEYLNEVYTGSQRMVELVNALLNVSRLDLGTFVINLEPTKIPEVVESLLEELGPQIKIKKEKIVEKFDKDLPLFSADKNFLRMILQNLLSNSVKYTPNGGTVSIEVKLVSKGDMIEDRKIKNNKGLVIKVSDSGIGIPKNQQAKIFEKLFRADNAKSLETEGTGLGLYIVKSILDQTGGEIWFSSKENKGTTFVVLYPLSGMIKQKKVD